MPLHQALNASSQRMTKLEHFQSYTVESDKADYAFSFAFFEATYTAEKSSSPLSASTD